MTTGVEVSKETSMIIKAAAGAIPYVGPITGHMAGLIFTPKDKVAQLRKELKNYIDTQLLESSLTSCKEDMDGIVEIQTSASNLLELNEYGKAKTELSRLHSKMKGLEPKFYNRCNNNELHGPDNFLLVYGSFTLAHMHILKTLYEIQHTKEKLDKIYNKDTPYDVRDLWRVKCNGGEYNAEEPSMEDYCRLNCYGIDYLKKIETFIKHAVEMRRLDVENIRLLQSGVTDAPAGWHESASTTPTMDYGFIDWRFYYTKGPGHEHVTWTSDWDELARYRDRVGKEIEMYFNTNITSELEELTPDSGELGRRTPPKSVYFT